MVKLRFDPDALQAAAVRLGEATTGIEETLGTLEAEVRTLIGSWDGEAAEAYETAQREWTLGLQRLQAILASASRATDASAVRYAAAQAKIAERWS